VHTGLIVAEKVRLFFLWCSEKDIEDDHYLVPCALYEAAMVHLSTEQFAQAKDLLTQAKYARLVLYFDRMWLLC